MKKEREKKILNDLDAILKNHFGNLISRVILYGSRVTGDAREYSDYDFLIILKDEFDWKLEREITNLCYDIDLKHDIVTDIHVISEGDLSTIKGKQPFIMNALESGLTA